MDKKEWFIKTDNQKEGPFSISELKIHPHLTPDTWVRKIEWQDWLPARQVPELKVLFEDHHSEELKDKFKLNKPQVQEDSTLLLEKPQPPFFIYWLIVLLFLCLYFFYQFYNF